MDNRPLIIFDGVCNFCNGAVNFIIARDPEGLFAFSAMQSEFAQERLAVHGMSNVAIDSFLLIRGEESFTCSDAALEICRELSGAWPRLYVLRYIPASIRNACYRVLARHRYRLFGRSDACMIPTQALRSRFIGTEDSQ